VDVDCGGGGLATKAAEGLDEGAHVGRRHALQVGGGGGTGGACTLVAARVMPGDLYFGADARNVLIRHGERHLDLHGGVGGQAERLGALLERLA